MNHQDKCRGLHEQAAINAPFQMKTYDIQNLWQIEKLNFVFMSPIKL